MKLVDKNQPQPPAATTTISKLTFVVTTSSGIALTAIAANLQDGLLFLLDKFLLFLRLFDFDIRQQLPLSGHAGAQKPMTNDPAVFFDPSCLPWQAIGDALARFTNFTSLQSTTYQANL